MKKTAAIFLIVLGGFVLKLSIVELERYVHVRLVDECLAQYDDPSQEQETACYGATSPTYKIIAFLNFQPQFWMNTEDRCVNVNEKHNSYFECRWWNKYEL
jgi:hypothetical protein